VRKLVLMNVMDEQCHWSSASHRQRREKGNPILRVDHTVDLVAMEPEPKKGEQVNRVGAPSANQSKSVTVLDWALTGCTGRKVCDGVPPSRQLFCGAFTVEFGSAS
jgi:hypothetical protein